MNPLRVSLHDSSSDARAEVLVGYGFNCYSFQVLQGDQHRELLWAAPGFETGTHRASSSGIPLLFPFPGRIQGTVFQWHGREYPLQEGDGRGNAIHGFVHTRPWRLTAQSAQEVTAEFQASVDDAELLEHWPGDFRIQGTYRIDGTCLASRFTVHNPGQDPLPCGFGTHPYFRLPLGPTGSSAPCRLHLPLTHRWELKEMVATGQKLPLPMADQWAQGVELGDTNFDDVLTGLQERDGQHWAAISDPQNDCQLTITFSRRFRECVVYTPGHREAVCIEPYTCVPDAARLAEQGVDAGLMVLAPGESVELQVAMEFRA